MGALILTALAFGALAAESAEAYAGKKVTHKDKITTKHVTKVPSYGGPVVHKTVQKVTHVKKVEKWYGPHVVGHGWPFYAPVAPAAMLPASGGYLSFAFGDDDSSFSIGFSTGASYAYEQVWIEPVTESVFMGFDACGRPIHQQVIVAPGHYRTARYEVFPDGGRRFVEYVY